MDITLTIHITEKQIPELIGLLAKMWDNPDPTASVVVEDGQKVVTIQPGVTLTPATVSLQPEPAPVAPSAPAEASDVTATAEDIAHGKTYCTPAKPSAAQVQAAAGAFMALDANNITVLQRIMQEFGVTAFPALKDDQLDAFVKRLRDLGVAV